MNKKMKKAIAGAVILSSGLAGTAAAATVNWDTISGSSSTVVNCGNGAGNSCTFNQGGEIVTARAYSTSNNNGLGIFEKATIKVYDGGIGVRNPDQSNEQNSPHHGVDNNGRKEMVVFEFYDSGYQPTGFEIGWKNNDGDIRAWIGGENLGAGYDFTGERFSDLNGLGFTLFNFNNVPADTLRSFNTDITGRYLIIAPQLYDTGGYDRRYDYFKISEITGEPQNTVPEPATVALLGIALVGFWANRRRQG